MTTIKLSPADLAALRNGETIVRTGGPTVKIMLEHAVIESAGTPQGRIGRGRAGRTKKICIIPGCGRLHEARGWCASHWTRWKDHGDPMASVPIKTAKEVRRGWVKDGIGYIPLTKGRVALVDPGNVPSLSQFNWYAQPKKSTCYACRSGRTGIRPNLVHMHREVMKAPPGLHVDHINHDGLDNRKRNLRLCTFDENRHNSQPIGGTSKYKGVSQVKPRVTWKNPKPWTAQISHNDRKIRIGYFDTEIEAAKAYDSMARKLRGRFAYLNFPSSPNE